MKIKCLIVDDEPLSQDVLKKYIGDTPMLELVGTCFDAFEANEVIQVTTIQILFLDINMPKLSGIRFIRTLSNPPLVIFTTAYPEYAIEGFEVDAIDYLVKPFSYERFLKAVNKGIEKIGFSNLKKTTADAFLLLKSDKKVHKVNFNDICYMQSFGDYIKVFTTEKCIVIHDTFLSMQEQLPGDQFVRVHKSYIIALDKIKYLEGNQVKIGDEMIPIGLTYRDNILNLLKKV
jgi:DNA-binding LytR/AlgR family response regulator